MCLSNLVLSKGSYSIKEGYLILRGASRLDAFSVYPFRTWLPSLMHLAVQLIHQRSVHPGPLVLRTAPLRYPTPAPDRDRTVSRRSEPSSRTALMGEQPNPWEITKSYFRICSTRRCHSQAPLCLCTLRMVSVHSEGTFERLRYPFGGDRPSQTPRQTLSPDRFTALG